MATDDLIITKPPLSFWQIAVRHILSDKLTLVALAVLAIITVAALLADVINAQVLDVDPNKTDLFATFEPPSRKHWLGTDDIGRDQLARLLIGARVSLGIGILGAVASIVLSIAFGMTAGYFGSWVDDLIMWFINTLSSIPGFFLLILVGALWNITPVTLILILALVGWTGGARVVRGQVFSVKERDYVLASRSIGVSELLLMLRHILPNILPILIIFTVRDIGILILTESGLSYLGLGVQPPTASWGNMLSKAQGFFRLGRHLVIFPGLLITVTVLCFYVVGDGLRDALDPRMK
ncbi:MAG: ABC transporter permease [Chloroflexota bacterium]